MPFKATTQQGLCTFQHADASVGTAKSTRWFNIKKFEGLKLSCKKSCFSFTQIVGGLLRKSIYVNEMQLQALGELKQYAVEMRDTDSTECVRALLASMPSAASRSQKGSVIVTPSGVDSFVRSFRSGQKVDTNGDDCDKGK